MFLLHYELPLLTNLKILAHPIFMAHSNEIRSFLDKVFSLEKSLTGMCTLLSKDLDGNRGYSYALIESKDGYLIVSTNGPDISLTNDEMYEVARQVILPEKYPQSNITRGVIDLLGSEDVYFAAKEEIFSKYKQYCEIETDAQKIENSFLFADFFEKMHENAIPLLTKGMCETSNQYQSKVLKTIIEILDADEEFRNNMWVKKR